MITRREILEQPQKYKILAEKYNSLTADLGKFIRNLNPKSIDFVGCGTSYFLSMGCTKQIKRFSRGKVDSKFFSGSEIMLGLRTPAKDSLLVGISRSGSSTETVAALKTARESGVKTVAITCEPESEMTKVADISINLDFIDERAIVMTKSFTSMAFLVSAFARELFAREKLNAYLKTIQEISHGLLDRSLKSIGTLSMSQVDHFVFLGYEEYFAASMEGIIKVTESSLTQADCYQTLEYRHGPKSKVHEGTLAVISTHPKSLEAELNLAKEIASLGGKVLTISCASQKEFENIHTAYPWEDYGDWFLRVIPLQILGIEKAISRGLNPDKPTNLTKVVKF